MKAVKYFRNSGLVLLWILTAAAWSFLMAAPYIVFMVAFQADTAEDQFVHFFSSNLWLFSPLAYFITFPLAMILRDVIRWINNFDMEK